MVSTTSLALPCIVPTFDEGTRNFHVLHSGYLMTVWIRPHLSFFLPRMAPSLLDMAPLYGITFDVLHDLIEAESFTVGCPS